MRVRFSPAAPRHIEYGDSTRDGRVSPSDEGYHIVPIYDTRTDSSKHKKNIEFIEETLTDSWTWFAFSAASDPSKSASCPGISYCFKNKTDAGLFTCFRAGPNDGLRSIDER